MANKKNDEEEKDFPGYPHYPAKEDILNQPGAERVDMDVENLSRSNTQSSAALAGEKQKVPEAEAENRVTEETDDEISNNDESDVTGEDIMALEGSDHLAVTGDDLDVPGSEEDDTDEEIGEEDEENNYYSLGGDAHENLEEDNA